MTNDPKIESEEARLLFAQQCDFVLAAGEASQFPDSKLNEIAFIGRSNVGKSSLINGLTNRKGLARASNTPGRTQQVVFFNLGKRLMLVDLPGYGHAEAPRWEKERWNDLVNQYLRQRPMLKLVCLLVDGRHGAKANDLEMMTFLDRAAVSYQTVLTKMDQVRPMEHEKRIDEVMQVLSKHAAARESVIATSSEDKTGLDELKMFLALSATV